MRSPVGVAGEEDLRALGRALNGHIDAYLTALSHDNAPPPSFAPGSPDAVPQSPAGREARRHLIWTATRILALATGCQGLYSISRQFMTNAAVQVAVDLNLAQQLPLDATVTAHELAIRSGTTTPLITRILRALTPLYIFCEVAPGVYGHTARSAHMRDGSARALLDFSGDECFRGGATLPLVLRERNYQDLYDPEDAPICKVFGTSLPFYDFLGQASPEARKRQKRFADALIGLKNTYGSVEVELADIYPFDLLASDDSLEVVVDVGGAAGADMISLARRYQRSSIHLHFIVQDIQLPVLRSGEASCPPTLRSRIDWMCNDFFLSQPVRGAAAYFLRRILHNHPDNNCRRILQRIVDAMEPRKSRLLIAELLMPESDVPLEVAWRDLNMMTFFASMERTIEQIRDLFESVDRRLKVKKVWKAPGSEPGEFRIIEAMLDTEVADDLDHRN